MTAEHVLTPDDKCPCGKPQTGSGYCSYECYSKHEPEPASMGGPLSEAERPPLTDEQLSEIERLWGGHQTYVRDMLAEIRRLRAMKCATCGKRIGYLNHKGYLLGWGCADAEQCEQGLPHRFDIERGEVLVEDSWFKVEDLPDILGNFMRSAAEHGRAAKDLSIKLAEAAARVGVLEGQLATARQQQLCTVVGAYVAWDIDNAKRNDLPIAHSIADKSEGKLRGAMATFQELLVALGEIEGDEDLEEVWELVEAEMQSAGSALGLDGGDPDER